ncbi:hypothetical protein ABE82_26455 (plasmid) [Paenibacillus peoriae]|uniref:hypothetical protein n=1 Tax=Paenibacillus peoriae TaxID=59893 RepID=UPI00071F5FBD|nr:hypothetical protein [Paenibacillus peoriae]ALS09957.1 hypothetical protein ABE82_26455 [Paenibacillus peoriae]
MGKKSLYNVLSKSINKMPSSIMYGNSRFDKKQISVMEITEPVTLSWVALMLAEGALQSLGGKVFESLLSSDLELDITKLQDEFFRKIELIVRDVINENEISECSYLIEEITNSMKHYNNSYATSEDRLTTATSDVGKLTSKCRSLGFKCLMPFCNAVALQISILQERLFRFKEPTECLNIVQICQESADYIEKEALPAFLNWNLSRFTEVWCIPDGVPQPGEPCVYKVDGKPIFGSDRVELEKMRIQHILRESKENREVLYPSLFQIVSKWEEIMLMYGVQRTRDSIY